MDAPTLLREIETRGARVSIGNGATLRVQPSRVLSDELRVELRSLKPEIVALLKQRESRHIAASENLASEYSQPSPDVFFEPCEDGGRFRCFYSGARLAAYGANEAAAPDDDLEARFADVLCAARLSEMAPSFCEVVLSACDDAQRIIAARLKKPIGEPVRDEKELRVLADLLQTLEAVQRDFKRRPRAP